jgi:hypothetical protein
MTAKTRPDAGAARTRVTFLLQHQVRELDPIVASWTTLYAVTYYAFRAALSSLSRANERILRGKISRNDLVLGELLAAARSQRVALSLLA